MKKEKQEIDKEKQEIDKEKQEINKEKQEIDFHRAEMFRIDRATLSIDEMDPTRSEVLIEQSREYKEKGQEVMKQIMAKKMTGVEGRQILDDKVKELKRVMDARRHKTKSVARKKIEKNYEKLMKKGWDKRDFDMDTVHYDERELVVSDEYSLHIPLLEVFVRHAVTMQKNILSKQEIARPEHYCMASVCLSGTGHFYTKTSNTPVLTPDGDVNPNFYSILMDKVRKNMEKVDDYEESNTSITCKQITMSYTISQWESIKKWYPENTPTMPIKKFLDFSVFLASNEEVNCEQQCVEYLNQVFYDNYAEQVPYLVCWADNDEVNSVSGEDCMEEFVDRILGKYKDAGEITLYAWYGSGYDYQHIYPYLKAKCTYDQCKLRNNAIIYAEFLDDTVDDMSHGVIHRMLIGGPKMYAYEYHDNDGLTNTRLHCKGVPTSMLSLDQFEHLLNDEDKYLAYRFAIMKKRIVGVRNRNIIKLIKKT
ncbi:hypothetical protein GGI20_005566 [Coemansia sp. BCRC 34301]|nr:hypothetical protein GGI20_005566 [Coemansia sp. BCRC 34301]